jgi:5,10-methylene-tetrahydrofolate dehydrogenase/methenyl tetrahydrofolate cyclohydrolase
VTVRVDQMEQPLASIRIARRRLGLIELSAVIDKCFAYTSVPGGVGPMTIATLIAQTTESGKKASGLQRAWANSNPMAVQRRRSHGSRK